MKNKTTQFVAKSNFLIDSFYSLKVREHQLLAYAISKIPRNDVEVSNLSIRVDLNEFQKFYGLERLSYKKLNEIVAGLGKRTFTYLEGTTLKTRNWSYGYDRELDGNGHTIIEQSIDVKFHSDVIPFLTGLSKTNPYTMYMLEITKDFKSMHTFPFYEMLAKTRHMREDIFTISIEQFKKKLCIESKYLKFKDLKKRVIDPIFEDLKSCTLLELDHELIKNGKSYTHIQVIFKESVEALPTKGRKKTNSGALKKPSEDDIKKIARPGESWESARERARERALELAELK